MSTALAVLCAVGVLALLWKPFFGNWGEFLRCVLLYMLWHDWWAATKMVLWLALGVFTGIAVFLAV